MSNFGYEVSAVSWGEIDDITENIRRKLGILNESYFPIVEVLEGALENTLRQFEMEIVGVDQMPEEFATTSVNGKSMKVREDIYDRACAGNGHARFTLAHELGHLVLHCCNVEVFALTSGEIIPPYKHSEVQANYFSASLLMPKKFFNFTDTNQLVVRRHGVSMEAARNRISYLVSKGYLKITDQNPRLF